MYVYQDYILPINHFEPSVFIYNHELDKLKNLDYIKNKSIIDVGAYIGDSALIFSELPVEKIYRFEATKDYFKLLQQTIKMNKLKNIITENVALGDKAGSCNIFVNGPGSSINLKNGNKTWKKKINVPMITLDEYVKKHNIEVGLIKVDIEGAEPLFLQGSKETICTQKPILLISIYHNPNDYFEIKPMIESWNLGYKFKISKPDDGGIISDTLLICEI
ncbi:hypothetical protein AN640_01330 [Candidatus Epulonipiscium fishelsonii]|uniref:Uncharacterized protein n=1 Tax=Candidatus Epulonipiscium fishelsonii TaxID=77094 RepID=A0ACC8XEQ8_9FIRM|nr:hypothetical protein AN640_01330 [Epulopiscium sp. SCG-D08WGA-EpuloA1]